ncbi:MAG: TIGR03790 family protein [Armatimonadota bacterium]
MLATLMMPAWAGGGPAGILVVYDQDDPVSVMVANHYQQVRGIPERNMLPVQMPASLDGGNAWKLVETLRAQIAERGLAEQLQGIALMGYAPLGARPVQGGGMISLASILYNAPNYTDPKAFPKAETNAAYRLPPDTPTICLNGYTPVNGRTYWPVSHVGPTDRAALSPQAARATIDQARAADGTKPDGVIYWPLNGDIRSKTREGEIAQVLPLWEKMGIKYSILDGVWVKNRGDIAGGVVGIASTDVSQNNRYLPGAWVDHLTSYGGVLQDNWQMPCTDFLLAGAGGSAGTMAEPYAIAGKFPHAHIYTHFRNGASLAESFWESIQMLNEILPVGDPLLQPYATFPKVTINAPKAGATVSRAVKITGTATGPALEPNLDVFVDGRKVKIGAAAETVKVTREKGCFTLQTTSLTDGWHEIRVVAYAANAVRTQGEAVLPLLVDNHKQAVRLTGPARVDYAGQNIFTVASKNLTNITAFTLRTNGRVLATATAPGTITVPGTAFPYAGTCTIYAIATLADGTQVGSPPLTVTVAWPGKPAAVKPALAPGVGYVRYFKATGEKDFSWDAAPLVELPLDESACQNRRFTFAANSVLAQAFPDWAKVDFANKPGMECAAWFQAPADDAYEFALAPAGELVIDGVALTREKNGLLGPLPLQAGWHLLRLRTVLPDAKATIKLQMRGGVVGKLGELPISWFACPAAPGAPPAPRVSIVKVDGTAIGTTPIVVASTKAILTAVGADDLRYTWSVVSAPRVGAVLHPDEQAGVTFTPTVQHKWQEVTAAFTAAGDYLLRVSAGNGQSCGIAEVAITVQPVATAVTITPARGTNGVAGYPLDLYATAQDQFGRRLPNAPAVTWSTTPAGNCELLSGETARFRAGTVDGPYQVTASAAGKSGTLTLTVKPNQPPKLVNLPAFYPSGKDTLTLSARAEDPEDSTNRQLTVQWTVENKPEGQTMELAAPRQANTTAKISGTGAYTVKFTATDPAGASTSATLDIKLAVKEDGTLVFAPNPRVNDGSALINQNANLYVSGTYGPATYTWETSMDGGAVWQAIPNATRPYLSYGPVTDKDKNRLFRVRAENELGTATSNTAKIVIRDPKGGIFTCDQDQLIAKPGADAVTVTVHRQRHTEGKVTLEYVLLANYPGQREKWAKPGTDYTDAKGTLTWENGDGADKVITVKLLPRENAPGRGFILQLTKKEGDAEMLRSTIRIWLPSADEPDGPKTVRDAK